MSVSVEKLHITLTIIDFQKNTDSERFYASNHANIRQNVYGIILIYLYTYMSVGIWDYTYM